MFGPKTNLTPRKRAVLATTASSAAGLHQHLDIGFVEAVPAVRVRMPPTVPAESRAGKPNPKVSVEGLQGRRKPVPVTSPHDLSRWSRDTTVGDAIRMVVRECWKESADPELRAQEVAVHLKKREQTIARNTCEQATLSSDTEETPVAENTGRDETEVRDLEDMWRPQDGADTAASSSPTDLDVSDNFLEAGEDLKPTPEQRSLLETELGPDSKPATKAADKTIEKTFSWADNYDVDRLREERAALDGANAPRAPTERSIEENCLMKQMKVLARKGRDPATAQRRPPKSPHSPRKWRSRTAGLGGHGVLEGWRPPPLDFGDDRKSGLAMAPLQPCPQAPATRGTGKITNVLFRSEQGATDEDTGTDDEMAEVAALSTTEATESQGRRKKCKNSKRLKTKAKRSTGKKRRRRRRKRSNRHQDLLQRPSKRTRRRQRTRTIGAATTKRVQDARQARTCTETRTC